MSRIMSRPLSAEGRENWDRIFGARPAPHPVLGCPVAIDSSVPPGEVRFMDEDGNVVGTLVRVETP